MAPAPKFKAKAIPIFPARVEAGPLVSITREAGVITISFDPSDIQQVNDIPAELRNEVFLLGYDVSQKTYYLIKFGSALQPFEEKLISATGDITIDDAELADIIGITNTSGAAINIFLPTSGDRRKTITIVDKGGNANTHNITVKPKAASGETIMTGTEFVMDSNGMSIGLTPWADGTGYH